MRVYCWKHEDEANMVGKGKSDEPEIPDLGGLAEKMEKAMGQARKAMADLPPRHRRRSGNCD
jgi:hypothetical protein